MRHSLLIFTIVVTALTACGQDTPEKPKKPKKSHFVETALVSLSSAPLEFTRTGTLSAKREVKIIAREEGVITELPLYEGDTVKKGELLASLDDTLLRAELSRAKALHTKAKQDLTRAQALYKQKLGSEENLNTAQVALKIASADEKLLTTRLAYTQITAPFDGVVSKRMLEPGNVAQRYTHLLTLTDLRSLITEVSISELLLTQITKNSPVKVGIDALGNQLFTGHVSRIHPSLNPQTRQATVEIEMTPAPQGARPGQFCRVLFQTSQGERLIIPFKALRRDEKSEFVFVVNDDNKIKRQDVVTGIRINEQIAVMQGLQSGQQVVTKGFLDLKPGKEVKVVNQNNEQPKPPKKPESRQ